MRFYIILGLAVCGFAAARLSAEPSRDQLRFFEERVRPVLSNRCFRCHGEDKQKGELRLDSQAAVMQGGESGAALTPGNPDESLLIQAVRYESLEMPPDGKLPDEEIEVLTAWVKMGAPWPAEVKAKGAVRDKGKQITDEDRAYWAFQPVKSVSAPTIVDSGWSQNKIDQFVLQRLSAAGLAPSPRADRRTLIRRLYLNLVGLPPSPEVVESFVANESPDAYTQLVDQLLDSPRYGEKWARHWLDLVRYAESDGFKQDAYRPQSWRYRDYVIRALNEDKPYDKFVREQLAGDEMAESDLDALAATAYLRHWIYEYNQRDVRTQWTNILNDITDVTAEVFLGLSVGCARCHDHKFDPILQKDYFRLQAFFAPLLPRDDIPFQTASERQQYESRRAEWEKTTADLRSEMDLIEQPVRAKIAEAAINKFPPDIRPMFRKSPDQRTPFEQQLVDLAARQVNEEYSKLDMSTKLKGGEKEKWVEMKKKLDAIEKEKPASPDAALTVTDVGPLAPVTFIPGDKSQQPIPPGFLSVLDSGDAQISPPPHARSTGRRTALANWIASADNPLTARVAVNRVWQYHFGQGIVPTSSDFGHLGEAPSHPELLDWLTRWFVDNGWSFKKLHRLIVTSAAYQQASRTSESAVVLEPEAAREGEESTAFDRAQLIDPENRLLWHMPIRRLDAEQIRDAALSVSGELKLDIGGPSVDTSQPRRTIYTKVIRNDRDPLLDVFDAPDNFNSTALRNVTTTPTQALFMINGPWMLERANALARRLEEFAPADHAAKIRQAFLLAYGRAPTPAEQVSGTAFLSQAVASAERELAAGAAASFAPFPGREGMALDVQPTATTPLVMAPNSPSMPDGDFTVAACVLLRSLYQDASVRTIVSQWDSHNQHPGWSLGVTSTRSRYEPRNLILQFVGAAKDGPLYEVVASNLRLELNKPYYVAARVRIADTTEKGITFWVKDLSDEKSLLQTAFAPHKVIKGYRSTAGLVIGGRDGNEKHRFDGLIDDVKISSVALSDDQLVMNSSGDPQQVVGRWKFEADSGILHDSSASSNHLTYQSNRPAQSTASHQVLVDFCHVVLNSNEFLYVD
jgi:hypothetical protein